jgi:hypothetical protein
MNTATRAVPRYSADAAPPVTLPPGRFLGSVTGVQVSADGHIWVLHIAGNMEWGPPGSTDDPAARLPPVCEFDAGGNYLQGWGGPDWLPRENGLPQWPRQEETIAVDDEDTIWVFGADVTFDHAVQRFTRDGRLLLRIGRFGEQGTDETPDLLGCPTDAWHDVARREVHVTDGYANHRVAVFDSGTGAFHRAWGAYGRPPKPAGADPLESFGNPVHAISRGPDGLLYVCDRKNDRVQVFDATGQREARFVREIAIDHASPFGTTFNTAFTPDGRFMIVNDGSFGRLWLVDLQTWEFVDDFLVPGPEGVGLEGTVHKIATDAQGNLLLARTALGIERLRYQSHAA